MIKQKNYQRRHLRAPFKENVLYADGTYVFRARSLNLSEGGILLDQLPSFPASDDVPLMLSLPQMPYLKNFSLIKMQTFSKELFSRHVIRVSAKMVRREELSQNLDNIFRSRIGLQFVKLGAHEQKLIEEYVSTFSSNLIYLQTLIDSFNTDEETKVRARTLGKILGYTETDRIAHLRALVTHDYKSLQWL
ncbi:MAG TPA: PilZ domain-containing protein [Bacteriovoracaceae bacterium]|nr:PilZ domain-containing protein [Bacteriovoracaceae bacterium]